MPNHFNLRCLPHAAGRSGVGAAPPHFLRTLVLTVLILFLIAAANAAATDYWASGTGPGVATNNDCGFIAVVHGNGRVRRSFQSEQDEGYALGLADRINSGDTLITAPASRIEWTSGNNIVAVMGGNSQVKFNGFRSFVDAAGRTVMRLDIELVTGELRLQVRLNTEKPEAALIGLPGAEALVRRGDVCLVGGEEWRGAVLTGDAEARQRRGGVTGAPFEVAAGTVAGGGGGSEKLTGNDIAKITSRLPFSFELARLAKPPLPSLTDELEAP